MWVLQYREGDPHLWPLVTVNLVDAVDEADAWDWAIAWLKHLNKNDVPEVYVRWI